jgi:PPM family protein phosphatase
MDHLSSASGSGRLRWFGETDVGHVRSHNEDTFLALQFNAQELHYLGKYGESSMENIDFVFAVSDGMGGAKAGELASRITVDKITHLLPRSFKQSAQGLQTGFEDIFTELFDQIHRALTFLGWGDEEVNGMQATLSLCWFTPGWMYFAHIGDGRVYYLPASKKEIKQISHDDTYVGWLFRTGQINERQAREHPRRTALQKALGGGNQFVDPQVGAVAYEPGDLFLLCTDGLIEGLFDRQLLDLLREPDAVEAAKTPAQRLVDASLARSGRDNTTALVIEML